MTTKSQGTRHSLPPKPMFAPPSTTTTIDDMNRTQSQLSSESCGLTGRDRHMESANMQSTTCPAWSAQGWSTTPPFPTPALTASSLSSSSFLGERSPLLAPSGAGNFSRRNFDIPTMTGLPPARSLDDISAMPVFSKTDVAGVQQHQSSVLRSTSSNYDAAMSSLSSSMNGLSMFEQQGRTSTSAMDAASLRMSSALTDAMQPAPLLIPMQPTGAGVPLTSVVETLSSKGSKAAAEDPETVAAAYKLSQWGIGIGPGINPKVASSRNGTHGRGRSTGSEPPIVNTGNSGPMCVQPGDWICTSCGFVNWRRRDVCMRCFPYADGNEISRGIQGGEMLAKRLAAGLDTDTEEYRRSVQALCPDKGKRGLDTYMQRPAVHELPRNPLQAYAGGSPPMQTPATSTQNDGSNVYPPPNLLGIHMSSNAQQQWHQHMDRSASLTDYFSGGHGHYQQQHSMHDQRHSQPPTPMQQQQQLHQHHQHHQHHQQQQFFGGDCNQACSPYKTYSPQMMSWMKKPNSTSDSVDYECSGLMQQSSDSSAHSTQFRTDAPGGRMSLFRSRTHTGAPELFQQQHQQQTAGRDASAAQGVNNIAGRSLTTGWSHGHNTPQEAPSGLPRDIWAPAPKRPTLVPVDPEDVSREKRAKPQPIGTRSASGGGSAGGSSGGSAAGSSLNGGKHNISEPDGRKDDKHSTKNKNNDDDGDKMNNNPNDYWISDSLGAARSGAGAAGASVSGARGTAAAESST
ncbi:uncharacterized protein SRS1_10838 [Sporisorium reilianum f. sp. reilianum]|uniref:RanBP2-type domain-containing protein n=1 Tax=Sporisorium reilianum f. sp. reilianum TaxID=72559 RepID=A0A2N8UN64_9BASI|nr:uncharacterized protein SRS1_10838 [Sporisorium reilianum f. sp. reilianum]